MRRIMLLSKIHRATLTGVQLDYEGSIAIDRDLLDAADMLPGEQVHVLNMNNATRLITYIIEAERGSGTVLLNGPAARLGAAGDEVIVVSFAEMDDQEARLHAPTIVLVDKSNCVREVRKE